MGSRIALRLADGFEFCAEAVERLLERPVERFGGLCVGEMAGAPYGHEPARPRHQSCSPCSATTGVRMSGARSRRSSAA